MYHLLIADDEHLIRRRISKTYNWNLYNIDAHVLEASNGAEALQLISRNPVDLIIADIRMPEMDGLEMLRQIRAQKKDTQVIFISGHSDFKYAQEGLRLGAAAYVLKPIDDVELLEAVSQCVATLELHDQFRQTKQRKFYLDLLTGYGSSWENLLQQSEELGISLPHQPFVAAILSLENRDILLKKNIAEYQLCLFALQNLTSDFMDRLPGSFSLVDDSNQVICAITDPSENSLKDRVESSLLDIQNLFYQTLGETVVVGVGCVCPSPRLLPHSFAEAAKTIKIHELLGKGSGVLPDLRQKNNIEGIPFDNKQISTLIECINNKDAAQADAVLSTMLCNDKHQQLSLTNIKMLCAIIVFSLFQTSSNQLDPERLLSLFMSMNSIGSTEEAATYLRRTILDFFVIDQKNRPSVYRKLIVQALEYMQRHFAEPLSLQQVAESVGLSTPYFCRIFSAEIGETFTKRLLRIRMEAAMRLLQNPTMKIYEVSSAVGYQNPAYFTHIFKEFVGVTPQQYRNQT